MALSPEAPLIVSAAGINLPEFSPDRTISDYYMAHEWNDWLGHVLEANVGVEAPLTRRKDLQRLVIPPVAEQPALFIKYTQRGNRAITMRDPAHRLTIRTMPVRPSHRLDELYRSEQEAPDVSAGFSAVAGNVAVASVEAGRLDLHSPFKTAIDGLLQKLGYGSPEDFANSTFSYGDYCDEQSYSTEWRTASGQ